MSTQESVTVRQWRQRIIALKDILLEDLESEQAKKGEAQGRLLISMASDEEVEQMARISADFFGNPYEKELKSLKKVREEHRKTVRSWQEPLGKRQE